MYPFSEEIAKTLCEAVLSSEDNQVLQLQLGNRTECPFYKQFFMYHKDKFLKYSPEETQVKMAGIYAHSQQEILKFKLGKQKLDSLNTPSSFYLHRIKDSISAVSAFDSGSEKNDGEKGDKTLNITRLDSKREQITGSINRGGNSAFNEDFQHIERDWDQADAPVSAPGRTLLDINLSSTDIDQVSIQGEREVSVPPPASPSAPAPAEEEVVNPAYTDITVNKLVSNQASSNISATKGLNNVKSSWGTMKTNASYRTADNKNLSIIREFTDGDSVYKALKLYVANFRESFLSSFSPLFISVWRGY